MGFTMLDNDHVVWTKDGESMVLLGVENWGKGFRQERRFGKALENSDADTRFTVLMSHDPTHYELGSWGTSPRGIDPERPHARHANGH